MTDKEKLLLPEDDGLIMRESREYVHYKLKALSVYLEITNTAMRGKPWGGRFYIDLQAGPGKNRVDNTILLGSPLIALKAPYPASHFRFSETHAESKSALEQRVSASLLANRVKVFQEDANTVVTRICDEIVEYDRQAVAEKLWSTLNIAFLDPEGLELKWSTVVQLATMKRMDLIINFSTGGLVRTIGKGNFQSVDEFFGTDQWRDVDKHSHDPVRRRRDFIDFYLSRLTQFGYHVQIDPDLGGDDIAVNNSRNAQVYSLIFASKNELGDKFWRQAAKDAKPPRLPGF